MLQVVYARFLTMENYTKGEVKEVEEPPVFSLDETGIQMRVTGGSKLKNLMGFAMKKIKVVLSKY